MNSKEVAIKPKPKPKLVMIKVEKDCIKWGDLYTQKEYVPNLNWKYVSSTLGYYRNLDTCGTKESNKKLTKELGISPKKFAHMLRGAQCRLWIKGREDLINKLCYRSYGIVAILLNKVIKQEKLLRQNQKDNLEHILPVTLMYGLSTKELKSFLGKSIWKRIRKNTFSRNALIFNLFWYDTKVKKEELELLLSVPSSILKKRERIGRNEEKVFWLGKVLKKERKLTKSDPFHWYNLLTLYNDTERMSVQLDKPFSYNWSRQKMKKTHDKYTKDIYTKKFSAKFIPQLVNTPFFQYRWNNYKATLLTSAMDIYLQGKSEHHCVGSYVSEVKKGKYLVFNIQDQEKKKTVSTLGITIDPKVKIYRLNQHYKSCNQRVDEELRTFADFLVNQLNIRKGERNDNKFTAIEG